MLSNVHEVFHFVMVIAFLSALAAAFVGVAAPLVFPDRTQIRLPALRTSLLLLLAAGGGLAGDWLAHSLLGN